MGFWGLFSLVILSFGDKLYQEGEYELALLEYLRENFFYPTVEKRNKIAHCYLKLGKLEEAKKEFKFLNPYKYVEICVQLKKYEEAKEECRKRKMNKELGYIYMLEGKWDSAYQVFEEEELKKIAKKGKNLKYKDEKKGVVFSTILPGGGEIYGGDYIGGGISFLITTLPLIYGVKTIKEKDYVTGALLLNVGMRFYRGSIYRGIEVVREYNKKIKKRYLKKVIPLIGKK